MKRTKMCPKCQSIKIGYMEYQPDANDVIGAKPTDGLSARSAHIQHGGQVITRALGVSREPTRLASGNAWPLYGRLEAYVCTACGYHETYVADVKKVEFDKLHGFVWINQEPEPEGPFR
jgi:hypothetical protein